MKIYNLTFHEMTQEQLDSLRLRFPDAEIDVKPRGRVFSVDPANALIKREAWVKEVGELIECNAAVVGVDTAAFMMLSAFHNDSLWTATSNVSTVFLAALSRRTRDANDRFVFEFQGWLEF